MDDEIRDRLRSSNALVKRVAWLELLDRQQEQGCLFTAVELAELHGLLMGEVLSTQPNPMVWSVAQGVYPELCRLSGVAPVAPAWDDATAADTLDEWLWGGFGRKSVAYRVADPDFYERDEAANIELRGHLNRTDFPETDFLGLRPDQPKLEGLRSVRAIAIVGRPRMFGLHLMRLWEIGGNRFRFPDIDRPPQSELPRGQLGASYHQIIEDLGPSGTRTYVAEDRDGQRTDYAIVQAYIKPYQAKDTLFVVLAGCSTLGTLAATTWAAHTLVREQPIPLPPHPFNDRICRMEALLRVVAEMAPYPESWRLGNVELLALYARGEPGQDRWERQWSAAEGKWHPPKPRTIRVEFHARDRNRVVDVQLDGQSVNFQVGDTQRRGSLTCQTLAECCRLAKDARQANAPNQPVIVAEVKQRLIKCGFRKSEVDRIRATLSNLKTRNVWTAIAHDTQSDLVSVDAQIELVNA